MHSPFKDNFQNFGFLSAEADKWRVSQQNDFSEQSRQYQQLQRQVMETLDVFSVTALDSEDEYWWAAIGLWIRAIEACQGAIRLADLGMAPSAISVLRTAYECVFYAAALWRKPERLNDWKEWTEKERHTQVKEVLKEGRKRFSEQQIKNLEHLLSLTVDGKKWSVYNAAHDAGLELVYQSAYRGLGLTGAHATAVSVGCYFENDENGKTKSAIGPDFSQFGFIFTGVKQCLEIAIQVLCKSSAVENSKEAP